MSFGLTWFWEWDLTTYLFIIGFLVIYFTPTIVAIVLGRKDWPGMFLFNFLIGWSIVGWFLILNWVIGNSS